MVTRAESIMTLGTILLIVLILLLIGALPTWPHSSGWGYGPTGGVGVLLVIVIVLLLLRVIELRHLGSRARAAQRLLNIWLGYAPIGRSHGRTIGEKKCIGLARSVRFGI